MYGITFLLTHMSHSHCPGWGTQTPGPHPGVGCAWVPPPVGPIGRPGSDQLHTMRSQSKSPSGTKPSHRAMGQITDTSSSVHLIDIHFEWINPPFISTQILKKYLHNSNYPDYFPGFGFFFKALLLSKACLQSTATTWALKNLLLA